MSLIGVISDIHGNLPALEAVMADLDARGITDIVNLGDHVSGPLWPRETAGLLMRQPWIQISGNHDRQVTCDDPSTHGAADGIAFVQLTSSQRDWLRALPPTAEHPTGLFLCHGTPSSDLDFLLEEIDHERLRLMDAASIGTRVGERSAAVVCCGHSHLPRAVRVGTTLVLNPGSVGLQAFSDSGPPAYVAQTGAPHARYAILHTGAWSVEHIAVAYDWERAAQRAAELGQSAWETALRTGFAA